MIQLRILATMSNVPKHGARGRYTPEHLAKCLEQNFGEPVEVEVIVKALNALVAGNFLDSKGNYYYVSRKCYKLSEKP